MLSKSWFNILLLIFATSLWGYGFVGTRWTLATYSPLWSNAIRFTITALIVSPWVIPKLFNKIDRSILKLGLICSLMLTAGMILQTIGVNYTTLAKSGFFTVFYAFFTPLISTFYFKKKLRIQFWLSLLLALVGIAFLCDLQITSFNKGDFLILMASLTLALHIFFIAQLPKTASATWFNSLQCFFMGLIALLIALIFEPIPDFSPLWQWSTIGTGSAIDGFFIQCILSSIVAFTIQVHAQKSIAPHLASTLFLLESVFAVIFGYTFFQETLTMIAIIGCFLVIISAGLSVRYQN
jgi:drug/metabolite transporter (DMT)-like permease